MNQGYSGFCLKMFGFSNGSIHTVELRLTLKLGSNGATHSRLKEQLKLAGGYHVVLSDFSVCDMSHSGG